MGEEVASGKSWREVLGSNGFYLWAFPLAWLPAPLLLTIFSLTGGNYLDGLFGVYRNSHWQDDLLLAAVFLTFFTFAVNLILLFCFYAFNKTSVGTTILVTLAALVAMPFLISIAIDLRFLA